VAQAAGPGGAAEAARVAEVLATAVEYHWPASEAGSTPDHLLAAGLADTLSSRLRPLLANAPSTLAPDDAAAERAEDDAQSRLRLEPEAVADPASFLTSRCDAASASLRRVEALAKGSDGGAAAAAEVHKSWLRAAEEVERLDDALHGFVGDEEVSRRHGYSGLRANLTAMLSEATHLSPGEAAHASLAAAVEEMLTTLGELEEGADGDERQRLEALLEARMAQLLRALELLSGGQDGEGCAVFGSLSAPRVAASLRISPAHSRADGRVPHARAMPRFEARHADRFNASHTIRHLSFGAFFPGKLHPLDGVSKATGSGAAEMRYLLKVVPCAHTALDGTVTPSSLFSVTEHTRQVQWRAGSRSSLPGVLLQYDIVGQKVVLTERRGAGLLRAVARVCALVGGVFTVAGIVDSLVYQSVKHSLGKQS